MHRVAPLVVAFLMADAISAQSVLYLCQKKKGIVRPVATATECLGKERLVTLNVPVGPQGPQGAQGPQGTPGPQGPPGTASAQLHLFDGAGNDLGELVQAEGSVFTVFHAQIGALLRIASFTTPSGSFDQGPQEVLFENSDCTGQAYVASTYAAHAHVVANPTRVFAATLGGQAAYPFASKLGTGGGCSVGSTGPYGDLVPAQDVTTLLGYASNPLSQPLTVGQSN